MFVWIKFERTIFTTIWLNNIFPYIVVEVTRSDISIHTHNKEVDINAYPI